ncbi:MAG TPA: hydrolase [Rhizomicrobium sp.]|nr:hydrolase [Rhizomicrobium sp.]
MNAEYTPYSMLISQADKAMLAEVEAAADLLVERAIGWCAINTGSRNLIGLATQACVLESELALLPGTVERKTLAPVVQVGGDGEDEVEVSADALLLTVRPQAPLQVVLTGHYDTVYPQDTQFRAVTHRPDGALHGPGIADMKGGLSVMLGALASFEHHPEASNVGYRVLLSPDEETGSLASAPLLAGIARSAHLGLTYEPAMEDGALASARKGSGNFHVVVKGRTAHAGRDFAAGRNAVTAAALLAVRLAALNDQRRGVTLNVARMDGGGALNTVPDKAVLRFNVRYPDAEAGQWALDQIRDAIEQTATDGISLKLHGGLHRPAKPFTNAQKLLFGAVADAALCLGQTLVWKESGGVCEGNNLFAAGLPNIDTLGVRGGAIHSEAEFAWPESFVERAQLSALILARIATGRINARAIHGAMAA